MKVMITGGCGFVGSNLVKRAVEAGWEVTVYDDFSRFPPEHLGPYQDAVTVVKGAVEDLTYLKKVIAGSQVVYHLAASSRQTGSLEVPHEHFSANLLGTHNVLEACRSTSARVIYPSTWVVYDVDAIRPHEKVGETTELNPTTPYALAKKCGEEWGVLYANLYDVDFVAFRFSNVYGPGDKDRLIPATIAKARRNEAIRVFGDPHYLNFIHVNDVAEALVLAGRTRGLTNRVFNLGRDDSVNLKDLARLVVDELKSSSDIRIEPLPPHEYPYYLPDTQRVSDELGFRPKITLEQGVRELIHEGIY